MLYEINWISRWKKNNIQNALKKTIELGILTVSFGEILQTSSLRRKNSPLVITLFLFLFNFRDDKGIL